ncbi:MAG: tetratricopeptide repeat protein [Labilithrix sp.]|nr:tetratricopeptide repeat protein [Labilithrix sp.]MCW5833711.1 tetratricopeptide repeat protein [Labilithrix sp.]
MTRFFRRLLRRTGDERDRGDDEGRPNAPRAAQVRLRDWLDRLMKASVLVVVLAMLASMAWPSARPLMLEIAVGAVGVLLLELLVLGALLLWFEIDAARRTREARSLNDAYRDAFARGDADAADAIARRIAELQPPAPPRVTEARESVGIGERLLLRQDWAAARDVLSSIDRKLLEAAQRPGVLNNLAYATAQAGDPDGAIALAERALAEAERARDYPPDKVLNIRGTRGIALSLAGRHEEAVAALAPLLEARAAPHAAATRGFYLGSSLWTLARRDDARREWRRAASLTGPFAIRARERLAATEDGGAS